MTKAITEIGGATALTAKEQAQVNAKLTEAIEKYKALGQVAPQNMQDLERATRQVNQETGKTSTSLKDLGSGLLKMASAIGIAFSAEAIVGGIISRAKRRSPPPARFRISPRRLASPPKRCSGSAMRRSSRAGRSTTSPTPSSR